MIVEFQDVVKEYGSGEALQKAVDHVSFGVEEGEFVVILGQSGAGKSTVLKFCLEMNRQEHWIQRQTHWKCPRWRMPSLMRRKRGQLQFWREKDFIIS